MTPEDTPRMAERTDRQAQVDPWAQYDELKGMPWNSGLGILQSVDAARAADAALLRERDAQIASLTAERDRLRTTLEQIASCNELSPFPGFARSVLAKLNK